MTVSARRMDWRSNCCKRACIAVTAAVAVLLGGQWWHPDQQTHVLLLWLKIAAHGILQRPRARNGVLDHAGSERLQGHRKCIGALAMPPRIREKCHTTSGQRAPHHASDEFSMRLSLVDDVATDHQPKPLGAQKLSHSAGPLRVLPVQFQHPALLLNTVEADVVAQQLQNGRLPVTEPRADTSLGHRDACEAGPCPD